MKTYEYKALRRYKRTLVIPDEFEFSEYLDEKSKKKNYFCVIPDAFKWKEVLDNILRNIMYYLPLDFAIIFLRDIKFLGPTPPIISELENNNKLERLRKKVVWRGHQSIYKLAWISGRDYGVSLLFSKYNEKLLTLGEGGELFLLLTERLGRKPYTGAEAERIWNEYTI